MIPARFQLFRSLAGMVAILMRYRFVHLTHVVSFQFIGGQL